MKLNLLRSKKLLNPVGLRLAPKPANLRLNLRKPWVLSTLLRLILAPLLCTWRWKPLACQADDEVITTPYTFAASAEVIRYFDARPVFVDVEPDTLNIDPLRIEEAITDRTRAIIPVHVGGLPADMESITAVAHKYHLAVIEDAAHAFPTCYKGRMIGSLSDFTCFSLLCYQNHHHWRRGYDLY